MRLGKSDLLGLVTGAIQSDGGSLSFWNGTAEYPFQVAISRGGITRKFQIYIWNITHGGNRRPADEYRIQVTGVDEIEIIAGVTTLILGYYSELGVFAGWDASRHFGNVASSPSYQVKESALKAANIKGLALFPKSNEEVVACFVPSFLNEYAFTCESLHGYLSTEAQEAIMELVEAEPEESLEISEGQPERQRVIRTQCALHRSADFRRRVLAAYQNKCAVSGMQFRLLDAAHILPVTSENSHDGTSNGLCLSTLFHRALDQGLVAVLPDYTIAINELRLEECRKQDLSGGYVQLISGMRTALDLPVANRDRPSADLIAQALIARNIDMSSLIPVAKLQAQL